MSDEREESRKRGEEAREEHSCMPTYFEWHASSHHIFTLPSLACPRRFRGGRYEIQCSLLNQVPQEVNRRGRREESRREQKKN